MTDSFLPVASYTHTIPMPHDILHALTSLGQMILAFVAHGLEQLFLDLFAFGTVDFDVLAPLRHVVLVVAGLPLTKKKIGCKAKQY